MRQKLFRDLGHSSINQYAIQELGFGRSKAGDLDYTKARELPECFRMNLTPEQEARRSAMVERLH